MYIWNGIKIYLEGENSDFISDTKKFFSAAYSDFKKKESDIVFSINDADKNSISRISKSARLIKSHTLVLEKEISVDTYANDERLLYVYRDLADIQIDFKNNKVLLSLSKDLFSFSYYNILFFFLYPLSMLLENFDYFRAHSSCVTMQDKAFLFTGESGMGKSTSAFAVAAGGGSMVSDDMTFIKKTDGYYRAYTITKLVKLRNDIISEFFPVLLKYRSLKNDEEEMFFDVNDLNKKVPEPSVVSAIFILEKTGRKKSDIEKIHPSQVVPHIFPSSIRTSIEKFTDREFIFFTSLLNDVSCYKVYFGTDMRDFYKTVVKVMNPVNQEVL